MRSNARKAASTLPGITGTARVGTATSAVLPLLQPGDIAVVDQVDIDRDTATALVEAGVAAVVNAASMVWGHYANLGPEVLAGAGVVLVDRVGQAALDRIEDDQSIRVHDGVVHAVGADGQDDVIAHGRLFDPDRLRGETEEQPHAGVPAELEAVTRIAGEFVSREHGLLFDGRGLPRLTTQLAGRPVVVVGTPGHGELQAVAPFVRERAPVVIALGAAAEDLLGVSWVPDIVIVTAGDPRSVPSADALRVAADVVLTVAPGTGRWEQATLEAMAGPPGMVETSATAEDVALLLADRYDASLVVGVGLRVRLEQLLEGPDAGPASSFATRLKIGERLVDTEAVRALYTGRPGALQVSAVVLAGLVALLAAIAVTPVGQGWAHDIADWFQGLT